MVVTLGFDITDFPVEMLTPVRSAGTLTTETTFTRALGNKMALDNGV